VSDTRAIIFIVDDDVSVRESLAALVTDAGWHPTVFASAQAFLRIQRPILPSCLILDVNLPDLNGLELQQRISADRTTLPIIFITGRGDIPTTVQAMRAGAVEFLTKPFAPEVLLNAIQAAIERSRTELAIHANALALRTLHNSLSRREREVMALVVQGQMNKQVAGALGISEITVKAHRGRVMHKMNARTFAELVEMAAKLRAVPFSR
jgi:FixJ family two-component response regulator